MDGSAGLDRGLEAARTLADLALEYADRAQAVEAELLAEFASRAAALAAAIGPLVVESDEDERVLLRADGVLAGEVLDDESGSWTPIDSPEEVVRYYDPTDLFLDLADALVERFPEIGPSSNDAGEGGTVEDEARPMSAAPSTVTPGAEGSTTEDERPAATTMLEDLHRHGVLTDAEFERLVRDLGG